MTTEELKKELEELGLTLKFNSDSENEHCVIIVNEYEIFYAVINLTKEYVANIYATIFEDSEKQRKLFNVVTEYAATPIKERDPKRYFKYRLKPFAKMPNILIRYLSYDKNTGFFDLQVGTKIYQTIFEENDPKLDKVNLEMFDAIEVNTEGNEL